LNGMGRRKWTRSAEDVWKDRTILWGSAFLAILTFIPFISHSPFSSLHSQNASKLAGENYRNARADAKLWRRERREALERVRGKGSGKGSEGEGGLEGEMEGGRWRRGRRRRDKNEGEVGIGSDTRPS